MDRSLYDAATKGDLSFLEKIRSGKESINLASQQTPKDNNVLHIAAEFKQMNFFEEIKSLHQSPRLWVTNKNNETPLHVAARAGCDEIVKFIIGHATSHPDEGVDQEAGSIDIVENAATGEENRRVDVENGAVGEENGQAVEEIEPAGEEIELAGKENGATDVENGAAGEDNGAAGEDNGQAGKANGPAGEEIEPDGEENGVTDLENGAANEENRQAAEEEIEPIHEEDRPAAVELEPYKKLLRMTNLEMDTALHVAIRYGHDGVVTSLVEKDPELCRFTNRHNESPLFLAIRRGSPSIIRYILNRSPSHVSFQGTNGMTALHAAVTRKHLNPKGIVQIMVTRDPQLITKADRIGWTPLHYAAFNGNLTAITQQLIEHQESACYMLDNLGMSALHVAAYAGHNKILKELIQRHPDTCDLVNLKGQTALHVAVVGDQIDVIKYVLKTPKLARLINQADNDGNTPMHLAAICDNRRIFRLLGSDRRLDTMAINNGSLMASDIFLNKIERTEITPRVMKRLGRPIPVGVTSFQQQIEDEFGIVVPRPEEEDNAATPAAITHSDQALKRPDTKLVVAGLIATVTFTVAIHVPGGLKTDGRPVLEEIASFKVFNFFNTFAFLFSILAIANECTPATVLSTHLPTPASLIQYSLAGMFIAFFAATSALEHKRHSETLLKYLFGTRVDSVLTLIGSTIVSALVLIPISKTILQIIRRIIIRDLRNQVI